ncbi:MAG: hypothetical protein EAZ53_06655 [Bacteroidetes bacterium]|nr:MAG: hypothetical protein EAZ53_06655 [Bacteroidota bacterium]
MLNFVEIKDQMKSDSIALSFKGNVTFELVDSIIIIISDKLDAIESDINTRKKMYGILTECLQNLCNHTDDKTAEINSNYDIKSVAISVTSTDTNYEIKTGNFVSTERSVQLKSRVDEVNSKDKDGLKALYNQILTNKVFSDKGGGGLGFIDIARKSGEKLEYDFQKVDEKYTFFSLKIKVNKK